MRMSNMFSRTLREAPSGADSKGYEYLLRAGFIRQMGAGIFSLLPLGFRATAKIESIIREEMERIGAQEILMPVVNTADIWKETGRYYSIDKEMSRFEDRAGRDMVLAMTHEEAVTDLARGEIDSYRRLPLLVYQIQTKWRDDPRPRAGLIRVREFTMKDSYSFDRDQEGLDKVYRAHYKAYFRIFSRCALPAIAVGADSGMMGGKVSHEYMYLSPIGEDTIITCPSCGYTANRQVATFQKDYYGEEMKTLEKVATPDAKTIEDLCAYLHIEPRQTAKAVFMVGTFIDDHTGDETEKLIVAIIRGDMDVEESKLSNAAKANSIRPAHEEEIVAHGIVPGFGSLIGADDDLIRIVDDSVAKSNNLVAGANEVGIGNIFQLGTRYSESMNCYYQDEDGTRKPVIMGSYGIGVGRLLACIAEEYNDEAGLKLPISVAPYQVHLISLVKDNAVGEEIYESLQKAGIEVLYDDRKESAGVKFADADLIGLPIRITIGNRSLKEGKVEVKIRETDETTSFLVSDLADEVKATIARLQKEIDENIVEKELD